MKRNKILLPLLSLFGALSLQSCAKSLSATACQMARVRSNYGFMFSKSEVKVYDGAIEEVELDETYSPSLWARLDDASAASLGEDNVLSVSNVMREDGSEGTLKFARYIKVLDETWYGTIRNEEEDPYYGYSEYVQYHAMTLDEDSADDLIKYLCVQDASTYKLGSRIKQYYSDVTENNAFIMKAEGDKKDKEAKLTKTDTALHFFSGGKLRSQNDAKWKSSIDALCTYFKGKKLNYKDRIEDYDLDKHSTLSLADDGVWTYNPSLAALEGKKASEFEAMKKNAERIEGCKFSDGISQVSLDSYFAAVNVAFASVEYASVA